MMSRGLGTGGAEMESLKPARSVLPRQPLSFWEVVAVSAWFGLLAGLLEVGTKVVCAVIGRFGGLYQMSRHFFWLIPVTNLVIFLFLGVVLAFVVRVWPHFGSWLSIRCLGALALLPALLVAAPEVYTIAWFILAFGILVQLTPFVERNSANFRQLIACSIPVLAVIVLGLAGWIIGRDWLKQVRELSRMQPPAGSPNVLFIVLDTVRADRLSVYGYHRKTSPTLERVAAEGVRFDAARSTSPWTLPSHGSMFTGHLPHELRAGWLTPLGVHFPTLAGYLSSQGYATAGFVANTLYCGYDTGLGEGFTHYEDYSLRQMDAFLMARLTERALLGFFQLSAWISTHYRAVALGPIQKFVETYVYDGKRKDASMINQAFFTWLSQRNQPTRPFFAFLNYMDAHNPYLPPRLTNFCFGLKPLSAADYTILENWEVFDKPRLDGHFTTMASDCYDDCIRYLDGQLQVLFSNLVAQSLLDQTLVIVVADHGESFGEHDLYVHGDSLYRSETHVPLLLMMPWFKPARNVISENVSLLDLPATVVDLLNLEQDAPFANHSLAQTWSAGLGKKSSMPEFTIAELAAPNPLNPNQGRSPAQNGPLIALTNERYTYIHGENTEELYDEVKDPREQNNLARESSMKPVLDRFRHEVNRILPP